MSADRRTDPADVSFDSLDIAGVELAQIDVTQLHGCDVDAVDLDFTVDLGELEATDALLGRLAQGHADSQDCADPAVGMLAGLVRTLDADSDTLRPNIPAMFDGYARQDLPTGTDLDSVISLRRRSVRRAGSMRHANVARVTPRTVRLAPLTSAAAAAAIVVAGALLVNDVTPSAPTPGSTVASINSVGAAEEYLLAAYDAAMRGDKQAAAQYVAQASRILGKLPHEEKVVLAAEIRRMADQIGVTPPPAALEPSLTLPLESDTSLSSAQPDASNPAVQPTPTESANPTPSETVPGTSEPVETPTTTPATPEPSTPTVTDPPPEQTPTPTENSATVEPAPQPEPSAQESTPDAAPEPVQNVGVPPEGAASPVAGTAGGL